MRVERYESVESYAKICLQKKEEWFRRGGRDYLDLFGESRDKGYRGYGNNMSWDLGVSYNQAIQLATKGDHSLVAKCAAQVDDLVNRFTIRQETKARYRPSVAGSRVSVPDYLAGSPMSMRRKVPSETQNRSVNVYVGTTSWAHCQADDLLKRGQTILALLEFLQLSQVSINLYLVSELDGVTDGDFVQVIKVQSQPLDLSTAGFAIAHPAFARHINYGMAYIMDGYTGGFPRSYGYDGNSNYQNKLAKAIGMEDTDIYVPWPGPHDREIWDKPDQWVADKIQQFF